MWIPVGMLTVLSPEVSARAATVWITLQLLVPQATVVMTQWHLTWPTDRLTSRPPPDLWHDLWHLSDHTRGQWPPRCDSLIQQAANWPAAAATAVCVVCHTFLFPSMNLTLTLRLRAGLKNVTITKISQQPAADTLFYFCQKVYVVKLIF